jgi:carnitine 3-dehydrogenase
MARRAAIIGGGVIGGGWAARFLLNGWDVAVFDPDPQAERKIGEVLANARAALPALSDVPLPPEGRIGFCGSIAEAVEGAEYIQESVSERLDLKHRVFAQIQQASRGVPIGSSTSGFKPSELQETAADPSAIFVAHPFNPVYLLPLAEVVPSAKSDVKVIENAKEILRDIGMFPLHVRKEIDAHIADRFLEAVWREALWLVKDGVATTEEIDEAIRMGFGLRWGQMGLFETYRIAGGEAGMKHFMAQFGPALDQAHGCA